MPYSQIQMDALLGEFDTRNKALLEYKVNEYSSMENRIENFETIAALLNVEPCQVVMVYLMKHMQSMGKTIMGDAPINWTFSNGETEGLKQCILDCKNYLDLLAACIDAGGFGCE